MYGVATIRMMADFSSEGTEAKIQWNINFKEQKEKNITDQIHCHTDKNYLSEWKQMNKFLERQKLR